MGFGFAASAAVDFFFLQASYVQVGLKTIFDAEIANMRTKPTSQTQNNAADGLQMPMDKLFYLSCHLLDNKEGVAYAKSRLARDVLDLWLDKRFTFAGLSFDDSQPNLTEAESWCCYFKTKPSETFCLFWVFVLVLQF